MLGLSRIIGGLGIGLGYSNPSTEGSVYNPNEVGVNFGYRSSKGKGRKQSKPTRAAQFKREAKKRNNVRKRSKK